ncbi:MAG: bifunctional 4-hydroxy-2-oxoglutarate aldolase/2-dehydro-3-deoxy-phosphogluconate aldolase [Verrucomicrobia bacterium]|nr:bifunctional 4-hydroxy-2-oxoglutarate aldolase/2-dehydro-3-deoxy-phosphogluconate aldolase [Verrucomicrobiota bacterium]
MNKHPCLRRRIVPAATLTSADQGAALAEAMMEGGLDVVEVTFRTPAAANAIRRISTDFPAMVVGAGTVLSIDQLNAAIDAGATYAVSPGLNPDIVAHAQSRAFLLMPGVITASEIDLALRLGCSLLKFFPAEASGGINLLKALAGPYAHTGVKFLPTGGVDAGNASDYLRLSCVAAVGGSWMVKNNLIQDENWKEITRLCRSAVTLAAHL